MSATAPFRHAPADWTVELAKSIAAKENLALQDDHWEVVRSLQEFYARNEDSTFPLRTLKDALDEKFHHKGGMKFLYVLFPGGPVAQGCRIAGVKAPSGATDTGFGSVA